MVTIDEEKIYGKGFRDGYEKARKQMQIRCSEMAWANEINYNNFREWKSADNETYTNQDCDVNEVWDILTGEGKENE